MKAGFDSIAWCYDFLSVLVFGKRIRQSQIVLLRQIKENDSVLIIGGGTGWIINEILKVSSPVQIDYIESSVEMLMKARTAVVGNDTVQINFILGDENSIGQNEKYDIVIAFYFFDMFKEERLNTIVDSMNKALKQGGYLLYADFNINSTSPWFHKVLLKIMYLFFHYICAVEAQSLTVMNRILTKYSLVCQNSISTSNGFIVSEVYQKQ